MLLLIYVIVSNRSKRHTESKVNMMFLGDIPALVFPFAYVLLELLCGHAYRDLLHGIVVGHVYYFVADVVPMVYGEDLLHTPQFLIRTFGFGVYKEASPAQYVMSKATKTKKKRRHYWGTGRRLGSIGSGGSERGQSNLLESNHADDDDEGYEPNPTEEQKDEEDEQREFNILLQSFREVEVQAEVEMLLKEKDIELSVIQRAYMEEVNLQESLREMEKWAVRRSRAMDAICDEIIASKYM